MCQELSHYMNETYKFLIKNGKGTAINVLISMVKHGQPYNKQKK